MKAFIRGLWTRKVAHIEVPTSSFILIWLTLSVSFPECRDQEFWQPSGWQKSLPKDLVNFCPYVPCKIALPTAFFHSSCLQRWPTNQILWQDPSAFQEYANVFIPHLGVCMIFIDNGSTENSSKYIRHGKTLSDTKLTTRRAIIKGLCI